MNLRRALAASTALVTITATLSALPALAQDAITVSGQPYVLPEITLIANQSPEELGRTGATVEVATREDIEREGSISVSDYLNTLPGVSATSNGGFGTLSYVRLRGLPTQYVRVTIDGIDVSDPSAPQFNFNFGGLMTGDVGRIEVLKGPQSALYGSEAIGGVIAISTLGAVDPGTHQRANLEYGSYATRRAAYTLTNAGDRHAVALSLQALETNGFSAADENDGNTEADGASARRVSLSGRFDATETLTLGVAGFWQKTEVETDTTFPSLQDADDFSNGISRGLRAYAELETGAVEHTFSAALSQTDREENYGGFASRPEGERREVDYKGVADVNDRVTLAWGGTHSREEYASGGVTNDYINNAAFSEVRFAAAPDLDVALSARHDHNSQFGSETTGRLAVAWRATPEWTIRGQYGTGYRAPSLYELYDSFSGNENLQPETSRGAEIGAEYALPNGGHIRGTLFENRITDLIDYSFTTFAYVQIPGETKTRGVELAGETPLTDRLTLAGNFTYTDADNAAGEPLARVPARALNLQLDGDITERSRFGVSLRHASGTFDGGSELPTYTVVDTQIEYDITDQATGYLRIENLLDEEYQVIRGYGTSDRAIYAGLRANF
ncbi:TonB-dependent receptor [Paracoccus sp. TK19116]|uniref:TonB-dependent receptor n=1 Tax=Paracoccus albicereus TaxID=2922394 RepID=A0ABT1MP32_9RHOB|nr:TonB-dependent receptor [Paracoccus albicereus]MCQ0970045.1 TonB-dependent receptor [Paracoccus albicereus]